MYDHRKIDKQWQDYWYKNNVFKTKESDERKKNVYVLDMFPYPSGSGLHVGHIEGYTASDVYSRFKRLLGFNVLHPIGWDAFGLPAEQYAIKTGNHPKEFSLKNIKNFKRQLKSIGFSYDFDKEINTTDPEYYKWTQWIFLQLYKNDLAEYKEINVNWCEDLGTVLSNEEIIENDKGEKVSERGSFPIIQKPMKQWVLKITKYAQILLDDLDNLNWPASVKKMQRQWIGLEKVNGKIKTKLRDWIFSRQRFWGEPFPLAFDEDGKIHLITDLPIELPKTKDKIQVSKDGTSPLSNFHDWINISKDNTKLKRDTNTMPQWAGSSWYYLAFILRENNSYIPLNSKKAYDKLKKWLPVDLYIGGQEHAVLHLLYARFWHKVLYDLKIVPTKEPFFKLVNQGMILGSDQKKMSKSKNNGISPDKIVDEYGADALRVYELFMGAIWDDKTWSDDGIIASRKWIDKIYNLFNNHINKDFVILKKDSSKILHKIIKKVTNNLKELKFNIAISNLMVLLNDIYKNKSASRYELRAFLIMLSPFAPHLSSELLKEYFNNKIEDISWPEFDDALTKDINITIPVQISGILRAKLIISTNHSFDESTLTNMAKELPNIKKYLLNTKIKKVIIINNKIINFIIYYKKNRNNCGNTI